MNIGSILKVIGQSALTGSRIALPILGSTGILGAVLNGIVAAGAALDKSGAEKKEIALGAVKETHPHADRDKVSQAITLFVEALKLLEKAEAPKSG